MKKVFQKGIAVILFTTLFATMFQNINLGTAEASSVYISVETFSKYIANEISVAAVDGSYFEGLKATGLIMEGEFLSPEKNITRGDALVILNRADEYLNASKVDAALINTAIEKRISDISKVKESKRADVTKAYLKGFMKGYSNGAYCTDRELKLTKKITKAGALSCIKMLKDKSLRAKISPDGQLIRTTNLPKNAKTYPYILASFPNAYYEKERVFDGTKEYDAKGNLIKLKSGEDYLYPVDIDKFDFSWYEGDFKKDRASYQNIWVDKALAYVDHVFNVDYRTIGDDWVRDIVKLSVYDESVHSRWYQGKLEKYVKDMKNAKTIVKSKKVSADQSSMYSYDGDIYVRVYVKYQIVSTDISPNIDVETLVSEDPYKSVLFSTGFNDLRDFKSGRWVDGYFDVCLSYNSKMENMMGVSTMDINTKY